jgi:NADPH:quinone reductase-like Zn-dependent oxidoreductase
LFHIELYVGQSLQCSIVKGPPVFALQYSRFGSRDVLSIGPVDEPHVGPGQIRIAVRAAGVAPTDALLRAGGLRPSLPWPHVPGVDAAGVVDEVGAGVTDVQVEDAVFGAVDVMRLGGATAEYAVLQFWAPKPAALSWEEAAALGTSAETATRVLDLLDVHNGTTLLIDGAAGGVGNIAVQLAVARGARVIGTGSAGNQDLLREIGAIPTTYGPGLPDRVGELAPNGVDAALDVAGAGSLGDLVTITKNPAQVVTIADFSAKEHGARLSYTGSDGPDGRYGLAVAAELAATGQLRVPIRATFPLDRAAQAHELAASGHGPGKVVLRVT